MVQHKRYRNQCDFVLSNIGAQKTEKYDIIPHGIEYHALVFRNLTYVIQFFFSVIPKRLIHIQQLNTYTVSMQKYNKPHYTTYKKLSFFFLM